jgi:hypothetical protein
MMEAKSWSLKPPVRSAASDGAAKPATSSARSKLFFMLYMAGTLSRRRARLRWFPPGNHALNGALAFAHRPIVVARFEHDEAGARNGRHNSDVAAGAAPINCNNSRCGAVCGVAVGGPIARNPKFAPLLLVADFQKGCEPAAAPIVGRAWVRTIARTRSAWRRCCQRNQENRENASHVVPPRRENRLIATVPQVQG